MQQVGLRIPRSGAGCSMYSTHHGQLVMEICISGMGFWTPNYESEGSLKGLVKTKQLHLFLAEGWLVKQNWDDKSKQETSSMIWLLDWEKD